MRSVGKPGNSRRVRGCPCWPGPHMARQLGAPSPAVSQGEACLWSPAQGVGGGRHLQLGLPAAPGYRAPQLLDVGLQQQLLRRDRRLQPRWPPRGPPRHSRTGRLTTPPLPSPPPGTPTGVSRAACPPQPSSGCISWSSPGAAAPWAARRCSWGPGGGGSGRETRGDKPHYEN